MFHRLFGLLVPGKMVTFSVTSRRSSMRVRRLLVKLSRSLMRIICHFYSPRIASSTLARPPRYVHPTHKCEIRAPILESILLQLHPTTAYGAFAL